MVRKLIEKIKEYSIKNSRARILKNYYTKEMKGGKTYRASLADRLLLRVILFLILSILLYLKSSYLLLSLYISGISIFFFTRISTKYRINKEKTKINEIHEGLKRRKIIRQLSSLNKDGFVKYVKGLLEGYYGVEISEGKYFDLECRIADENYGIKCLKIGMDEKVIIRELEDFNWELRRQGMDDGILVTNSYFRDDLREEATIILHDFDNLILMLKKEGKYPSNREIEDYIIDRFLNRRKTIKKEILAINLKKTLQLYGLFAIFYLMSYFVKYSFYYKIISIIFIFIITMVLGYKFTDYVRERDSSPLNKKIKS